MKLLTDSRSRQHYHSQISSESLCNFPTNSSFFHSQMASASFCNSPFFQSQIASESFCSWSFFHSQMLSLSFCSLAISSSFFHSQIESASFCSSPFFQSQMESESFWSSAFLPRQVLVGHVMTRKGQRTKISLWSGSSRDQGEEQGRHEGELFEVHDEVPVQSQGGWEGSSNLARRATSPGRIYGQTQPPARLSPS